MNKYEGMFILDPAAAQEDLDGAVAHVQSILEKHGATVADLAKWEERSLCYEIAGKLGPSVHCHCRQCRKASGASFATNASVSASDFRFVEGEALVGRFESSPGQLRCFCTRCGSPLIKRIDAKPDEVRLRLGTLDSDPETTPAAHIFVRSRAPWTVLADDLPRHE